MNEIIQTFTENLTPLSVFLILLAGIVENSKKIGLKPITSGLKWIGCKLNADISSRLDMQEAYLLNNFYNRHKNGDDMTAEQYESAITMFEEHLKRGANSVNALHLEVIKDYYKAHFKGE